MALLFILFPLLEVYVFFSFASAYSFLDAFLAIFLSGVIGSLIMRLQGKAALALFQTELLQGRIPGSKVLHRAVVFLGGLLLFMPGFISDFAGALFILPGTRHLVVLYIKSLLKKGILRGRVFMGGFGLPGDGGPFTRQRQGPFPGRSDPRQEEPRVERDAQVIDIEPLEIIHSPKKDDSKS